MFDSGMSFMLSQVGYQLPAIVVYLVAGVAAVTFLGRARVPSLLTLAGVGVLLLAAFGITGLQAYLFHSFQQGQRDPATYGRLMQITGMMGSFVRAAGLLLLVAAIFVDRRAPQAPDAAQVRDW